MSGQEPAFLTDVRRLASVTGSSQDSYVSIQSPTGASTRPTLLPLAQLITLVYCVRLFGQSSKLRTTRSVGLGPLWMSYNGAVPTAALMATALRRP